MYCDGRVAYYEDSVADISMTDMAVWLAGAPNVAEFIRLIESLTREISLLPLGSRQRTEAAKRLRKLAALVTKDLGENPSRAPRTRRALLRLADELELLFPGLSKARRDEAVHIIGEHLGVATLGEEGYAAADRASVRRSHVSQWRRDYGRERAKPRAAKDSPKASPRRKRS